jgi:hypothetical protein
MSLEEYVENCLNDQSFMCDVANDHVEMSKELEPGEVLISLKDYAEGIATYHYNSLQERAEHMCDFFEGLDD